MISLCKVATFLPCISKTETLTRPALASDKSKLISVVGLKGFDLTGNSVRINHADHGMYSTSNNVTITGVSSGVSTT